MDIAHFLFAELRAQDTRHQNTKPVVYVKQIEVSDGCLSWRLTIPPGTRSAKTARNEKRDRTVETKRDQIAY